MSGYILLFYLLWNYLTFYFNSAYLDKEYLDNRTKKRIKTYKFFTSDKFHLICAIVMGAMGIFIARFIFSNNKESSGIDKFIPVFMVVNFIAIYFFYNAVGWPFNSITTTVLVVCLVWNLFVFLLYGADKWSAEQKERRISERCLIRSAFAMGAVGAWAGRIFFHHKTQKTKFNQLIPVALLVNIAVLALLFILGLF